MDRATELELLDELLRLNAERSAYLDDAVTGNPVERYVDSAWFQRERAGILRMFPQAALHASELPEPGSFLRRDLAGLPVLFTRDAHGEAHAFLNVCRHRGTRLVEQAAGCRHRFSCPYHAWTWNNRGELVGIPHEEQGFPGLDRAAMGLKRLVCVERYGWLWVSAADDGELDVDRYLEGLAPELDWFGASSLRVVFSDEQIRPVNWKLLIEGGIEAYHFRVAHRRTIAPYFMDNLSTYRTFGPHLRSILARRSIAELPAAPRETWSLRQHAQVLYTFFPTSQFLVQSDHVAWVHVEPMAADATRVRLSTLVPEDRVSSDEELAHWAKNHEITVTTLTEDFEIGERIQAGLESGANEQLTFGRFEGALAHFNAAVADALVPSQLT